MTTKKSFFAFLNLVILALFIFSNSYAQVEQNKDKNQAKKEVSNETKTFNQNCFKCHGKSKYEYPNADSSKIIKRRMGTNFRIPEEKYYVSNHYNFKCTDCHSSDYGVFPHKTDLFYEEKPSCLDCHSGDEQSAKYRFEQIAEEFQKSVHSTKHSTEFTCWMCHDPHTYKINARSNEDISQTIAYDNAICLTCHADVEKYQLIADKANPNILNKHEWLPNQKNHFNSVRCIECHAVVSDSIVVAHNIQPKAKAVKRCVECHSKNSLLLQSLYKYQISEKMAKGGFFNAVILNDSFVIGANRNEYLNLISIVIFGLIILGVSAHAILRISKRKN